jgi:hypothetical protein
MSFAVKMPHRLWRQIHEDQSRQHEHAFERVGFLLARSAALAGGNVLLLPFQYSAVGEENYVPDSSVGARINSAAIREGLQLAMTHGASLFHVHPHPHNGVPVFSTTDRKSFSQLVPSFFNAQPNTPHGAIVFSHDSAAGAVWTAKDASPLAIETFIVVGSPQLKFGGR